MMSRTSTASMESSRRLKPARAARKVRAKDVQAAEAIVIAIVVVAAVEDVPAAAREAVAVAAGAADGRLFVFWQARAAAMRPFSIAGDCQNDCQNDKRLKIVSGICRTPVMM